MTTLIQEHALRRACAALLQDPPVRPTEDVVASLRLLHPGPPIEDLMEMDTLRRVAPGPPRLMWTRFVRHFCRSRRLLVRARPGFDLRKCEMRCALLLLTCFSGFFLRWSASCSGVKYQSWSDHTYAGRSTRPFDPPPRPRVRGGLASVLHTCVMRCAPLRLTCSFGSWLRSSVSCSEAKFWSWFGRTSAGLRSWLFASQTDL